MNILNGTEHLVGLIYEIIQGGSQQNIKFVLIETFTGTVYYL